MKRETWGKYFFFEKQKGKRFFSFFSHSFFQLTSLSILETSYFQFSNYTRIKKEDIFKKMFELFWHLPTTYVYVLTALLVKFISLKSSYSPNSHFEQNKKMPKQHLHKNNFITIPRTTIEKGKQNISFSHGQGKRRTYCEFLKTSIKKKTFTV